MIQIPLTVDVDRALADMRILARMTRRQVAEAAGISEQQYGQYERGHRVPSVATLLKIFTATGYGLVAVPREDA